MLKYLIPSTWMVKGIRNNEKLRDEKAANSLNFYYKKVK